MSDDQLAQLTKHFDDQFAKLHAYAERRFSELEAKIDGKASSEQLNRVYNIVDGIAKRLDDDDHERAAMSAQLDRHEGWIGQVAKNTGTKLQPEQ